MVRITLILTTALVLCIAAPGVGTILSLALLYLDQVCQYPWDLVEVSAEPGLVEPDLVEDLVERGMAEGFMILSTTHFSIHSMIHSMELEVLDSVTDMGSGLEVHSTALHSIIVEYTDIHM